MTHRTASDVISKGRRQALPEDGARRVILVRPSAEVDGGRGPVKRTLGETVALEVHLRADGHDAISGRVLFRPARAESWQVAPLLPLGDDRFAWVERVPRSCGESVHVHDLLSDTRFVRSARSYVELDACLFHASLFVVRREVRSEHDFESFP